MTGPIVLVLGAGPNIGLNVVEAFTAKRFRVVTVSRSQQQHGPPSTILHLQVDLAKPEVVGGVFNTVKTTLGAQPSVVIYNGKPPGAVDSIAGY